MARLKNLGGTNTGSTTNSGFDTTSTGWTFVNNWSQPAGVANLGNYNASAGNPGGYIDINQSVGKNKTGAAFWYQSFVTTVSSPDTATLILDWKNVSFPATTPTSYTLYAFIDTSAANPTLGTEVWSQVVTSTTGWNHVAAINISSKVAAAGTYYLKIGARDVQPNSGSAVTAISGFDNVQVNWSKTTVSYATSSPSTTPVASLSATKIIRWNSFTEVATPNGGSINYQLSSDNGANWKYWNGSSWATTTLSTNANSSSTINTNIASFATSTNQIKWRAFFVSNGSNR